MKRILLVLTLLYSFVVNSQSNCFNNLKHSESVEKNGIIFMEVKGVSEEKYALQSIVIKNLYNSFSGILVLSKEELEDAASRYELENGSCFNENKSLGE